MKKQKKLLKIGIILSRGFFILKLCNVDFLTEKQHNFFITTLKLYKDQDFTITTYYYKIILSRTDKFYENEIDYLLKYLLSYGASDYMGDIYEFFYKRDETKQLKHLII